MVLSKAELKNIMAGSGGGGAGNPGNGNCVPSGQQCAFMWGVNNAVCFGGGSCNAGWQGGGYCS